MTRVMGRTVRRRAVAIAVALAIVGGIAASGFTRAGSAAPPAHHLWAAQARQGSVKLKGQVPLQVQHHNASFLRPHPANARLSVSFGLPLRSRAGINSLIAQEARTHQYLSRAQLYARFSPPKAQYNALGRWLESKGLRITHLGADRLMVTVSGTTARVERALDVKINDYVSRAYTYHAIKVKPYVFYANTTSPKVPARFGIQTVSGLSDIDRFFTQIQLGKAVAKAAGGGVSPVPVGGCGSGDDGDGGTQCTDTRAGSGYYPNDIKSMYDVAGRGFDGTGQTLGFTLWGAGERQAAMTAFAQDTGDAPITVDTPCAATGNGPTTPSSCTTQAVAGNHLLTILENGNTNNNFGSNVETALDIEQAHGIANGAAMKYYDSDCTTSPPPGSGLSNGSSCNGSDVGMEEAIEDAANDPTLHTVSNSWAFGGEPEWGTNDPFYLVSENSLAIAAAAGTTFYFSTGDSGTFESGYPSDSQYVVGVGGTTLFSTQSLPSGTSARTTTLAAAAAAGDTNIKVASVTGFVVNQTITIDTGAALETVTVQAVGTSGATGTGITVTPALGQAHPSGAPVSLPGTPGSGTGTLSTEDTWAAGGSWCSNIISRPSWQDIPAVNGAAPCPGRVIPDVSAIADTNSAVLFVSTTNTTGGFQTGGVGGTSVAAPEMNGLEAVTENFIKAQSYPGATPQIGFEAPIIYQLGAENQNDYYRDVLCGNTASPTAGPDGDAAQPGWDPATGWGAPDWFRFATGYAMALGAEGLSTPSSTSQGYSWSCAKTPSNSTERGISFPSSSVGYAVGTASGGTPWPAKFLPAGSWGATNTFFKTTDGGQTWVPSNSDMMSIACTSTSSCVEVGDGGVIKTTSDGGTTWTAVQSPTDKALTRVSCPSSSVCYAAGDRGIVIKSKDGGQTWTYLHSTDGNPIYGLTCASVNVCYVTDIYAHIIKTNDGGATWIWEQTPVTTPGVAVPGSGGPNPFAGLFGVSCININDCVAVGGFPPVGTDPPIVATTNGGNTWTLETSNAGAGDFLNGVDCVSTGPTTGTCYAVGRGGTIVTTTDMVNWTTMTSNVSSSLSGIQCSSTTSCVATGQGGTIDVLSGGVWTPTTGLGSNNYLAGVSCPGTTCFTAGKQGATLSFDPTNVAGSATLQAGGGTTQTMNSISCASNSTCYAVGGGGTVLVTTNGGQTWLPQTSGTDDRPQRRLVHVLDCLRGGGRRVVGSGGGALHHRRLDLAVRDERIRERAERGGVHAGDLYRRGRRRDDPDECRRRGDVDAADERHHQLPERRRLPVGHVLRGRWRNGRLDASEVDRRRADVVIRDHQLCTAARGGRVLRCVELRRRRHCRNGRDDERRRELDTGREPAQRADECPQRHHVGDHRHQRGCLQQRPVRTRHRFERRHHDLAAAEGHDRRDGAVRLGGVVLQPAGRIVRDLVLAVERGGERDGHPDLQYDGRDGERCRHVPDQQLQRVGRRRLHGRLRLLRLELPGHEGAADRHGGRQVAPLRLGEPASHGDGLGLRAGADAWDLGRHR